jgi:hypothetical protein
MNLTAFFPPPSSPPAGIGLFGDVGLVQANLIAKQALREWDKIYKQQNKQIISN